MMNDLKKDMPSGCGIPSLNTNNTLPEKTDKTTPAPQYLLDQLKSKVTNEVLENIQVILKSGRISWCMTFIELGGHLYLLKLLSRILSEKDEIDHMLLTNSLLCIRHICNIKNANKEMANQISYLPMLVHAYIPSFPRTVEIVMQILLAFLYSGENDQKSANIIVKEIKVDDWEKWATCFTTEFNFNNILIVFLNGLWMSTKEIPEIRWELLRRLKESGFFSEFEKLNSESDLTISIRKQLKFMNSIYPKKALNIYSPKNLVSELIQINQPVYVTNSILLSLLELSNKNFQTFKNIWVFVYNMLTLLRVQVQNGDEISLIKTAIYADSCKGTIKLNVNNDKPYIKEVENVIHFYPLSELKNMTLNDVTFAKSDDQNEIDINQEQSSCYQGIIKELENKVKEITSKFELLNTSYQNLKEQKEEEEAKVNELTKQLQELNDKYKQNEMYMTLIQGTPSILIPKSDIRSDEKIQTELDIKIAELNFMKEAQNGMSNNDLINSVNEKEAEIVNLTSKVKNLNIQLINKNAEITKLTKKVESFDPNQKALPEEIEKLLKVIESKDAIINELKKNQSQVPTNQESKGNMENTNQEEKKSNSKAEKTKDKGKDKGKSKSKSKNKKKGDEKNVEDKGENLSPLPPPPPPPPPPPSMPKQSKVPKKANKPPPKKLKAIFWQRIQDDTYKDTIWKNIDDSSVKIDEKELCELFAQNEQIQNKASTSSSAPPKMVELLEPNRAKSISIMLTRFRRTTKELITQIKNLSSFNEDDSIFLKKNIPSKEEIQIIQAYTGDKSLLGKPEQYFLGLSQIKLLPQHLDFIYLKATFDSQFSEIEEPLDYFLNGLSIIEDSKLIKKVFSILLRIGNFVNGGTVRGGAYGFKIDFLTKLGDIRTHKQNYSLLNFLADMFEVDELYEELQPLRKCLSVDLYTIQQNYQKILNIIKSIKDNLETAKSLVIDGYILYPEYMKFMDQARVERVEKPGQKLEKIFEKYNKVSTLFDEDPQVMKMMEFINIFIKFSNDLNRAKENNIRMAKNEEKLRSNKNKPTMDAFDNQRGVLDELMKTLAVGTPQLRKVEKDNNKQEESKGKSELEEARARVFSKK